MKITTTVANIVGHPDTPKNLADAVRAGLGGESVDLLAVFSTPHFDDEMPSLIDSLTNSLQPRAMFGCSAEAVVCNECEYENQPAITVWAARLPGVHLSTFHISNETELAERDRDGLQEIVGVPEGRDASFVILADPFSFGLGRGVLTFLDRLGQAYPDRPALGGMASAGEVPNQNLIIFDGQVMRHGLVGVGLWGDLTLDAVVSQGCRPIGRHLVITKAEQNVIYQLGGKVPWQAVNEVIRECPTRDRQLIDERGLFVGCVINEYQPSFTQGDFLIRNCLGFDRDTGAMVVADRVRPGQTIQLHVRDSASASDDLKQMLTLCRPESVAGGLLFSCNGRGRRLFAERNHDARCVQASGAVPLAGFFCAGEIGPIGNKNHLHGHTASIAFFRPRDTSARPDGA